LVAPVPAIPGGEDALVAAEVADDDEPAGGDADLTSAFAGTDATWVAP
jgi:hypothetical protein